MPIIRSAKKKLRQDKKRTRQNLAVKRNFKEEIKKYKKNPTIKALPRIFSMLDKASKKKILHANKSSRLKSKLSRLLEKKTVTTAKPVSALKKKKPSKKGKSVV